MPNFSSICLQCHPPVQELANSWMLHYFICVCIYDHAIELFNYLFLFIFLNLSECEYDCMKLKHVSAFFVLLVSSASKIIWSFRMKFVLFLFLMTFRIHHKCRVAIHHGESSRARNWELHEKSSLPLWREQGVNCNCSQPTTNTVMFVCFLSVASNVFMHHFWDLTCNSLLIHQKCMCMHVLSLQSNLDLSKLVPFF